MTVVHVFTTCMILTCICTSSLGSSIWLEEAHDLVTLEWGKGVYVDRCVSSDERNLVVLTIFDIQLYRIQGDMINYLSKQSHAGIDLFGSVRGMYATHVLLGIITEANIYLFNVYDEKRYSLGTKRGYPAEYFEIKEFSVIFGNNYPSHSIIMKSGTNELIEIDLRDINSPDFQKIVPGVNKGSIEIDTLLSINYGKHVAVKYSDSSLYGVDLKTGESRPISVNLRLNPSMRYDYVSNLLIVTSGRILYLHDAATYKVKATIMGDEGVYPFMQFDMRITGMNIVKMFSWRYMMFMNTDALDVSKTVLTASDEIVYEYDIVDTFMHSNLVMCYSKLSAFTDRGLRFKFFRLKTEEMPEFCHPTCGKTCKEPFVICKNYKNVALAFILSVMSIIVFLLICLGACDLFEMKLNRNIQTKERRRTISKAMSTLFQNIEEEDIDRFNLKVMVRPRLNSLALINTLLYEKANITVKNTSALF